MVLEIKPVLDCDLLQIFATSCIPWSWKPDQSSVTGEGRGAQTQNRKAGIGWAVSELMERHELRHLPTVTLSSTGEGLAGLFLGGLRFIIQEEAAGTRPCTLSTFALRPEVFAIPIGLRHWGP